jgi:hypothetical protein
VRPPEQPLGQIERGDPDDQATGVLDQIGDQGQHRRLRPALAADADLDEAAQHRQHQQRQQEGTCGNQPVARGITQQLQLLEFVPAVGMDLGPVHRAPYRCTGPRL